MDFITVKNHYAITRRNSSQIFTRNKQGFALFEQGSYKRYFTFRGGKFVCLLAIRQFQMLHIIPRKPHPEHPKLSLILTCGEPCGVIGLEQSGKSKI